MKSALQDDSYIRLGYMKNIQNDILFKELNESEKAVALRLEGYFHKYLHYVSNESLKAYFEQGQNFQDFDLVKQVFGKLAIQRYILKDENFIQFIDFLKHRNENHTIEKMNLNQKGPISSLKNEKNHFYERANNAMGHPTYEKEIMEADKFGLEKMKKLLVVKNYAFKTQKTYLSCVRRFMVYCAGLGKSISEVTDDEVLEYAAEFRQKNLSTDLRLIQKLLGHSNISTTTIYTKVALQTIRAIKSPLNRGVFP